MFFCFQLHEKIDVGGRLPLMLDGMTCQSDKVWILLQKIKQGRTHRIPTAKTIKKDEL